MPQPLSRDLACLFVQDRYLLKARVKVTTYNQHRVGSFPEPLVFANSEYSVDRANVVMKSRSSAAAGDRGICFSFRCQNSVILSERRTRYPARLEEPALS